ncbi:13253_t:CDS:2, partial [Funneliformis geosporum]
MYNLWQTVCRKVEMGESSTTAIIREIDEETRIKLNKGRLEYILHDLTYNYNVVLPVDLQIKSVSINNKAIDDALLDRLIILIDKLELNKQYALDNMNQSQERQKDRYNNHRVSERLKIVGFNYYKLRSIEERIVKGTIHGDRLKQYNEQEIKPMIKILVKKNLIFKEMTQVYQLIYSDLLAITPTTITLPPLLMISSQDARKIIDTEYMTQKDSKLSKHYFIISKRVFLIFEDNLEQLMRTQYMTTALFVGLKLNDLNELIHWSSFLKKRDI